MNRLNTREPLSESSNINVRNDPSDSPLTRYGKRADHDIIVNFIKTANTEEQFLRDYNGLRQFGEINIPRRKDLVTLLQKYPLIAKQSLILTLVKDIARLDEVLEIFKDENIKLSDENDSLVEENEGLNEKIEDMVYDRDDDDEED
jgi:cell division protein FtsB